MRAPLTVVQVKTPDRREFERDAEAATRCGDPEIAIRYLMALCERRAWVETRGEPQYLAAARHEALAAELMQWCAAMGYHQPVLTHITGMVNIDFIEPHDG